MLEIKGKRGKERKKEREKIKLKKKVRGKERKIKEFREKTEYVKK